MIDAHRIAANQCDPEFTLPIPAITDSAFSRKHRTQPAQTELPNLAFPMLYEKLLPLRMIAASDVLLNLNRFAEADFGVA